MCDGVYDYVEISRLDVSLDVSLGGAGTDRTAIDGGSHPAVSVNDSTFAIEGFGTDQIARQCSTNSGVGAIALSVTFWQGGRGRGVRRQPGVEPAGCST